MRRFSEKTLLLATHNQGKVEELCKLFEGSKISIKSASDFNLKEPDETENSFVGNARIKAHFAATHTGIPALADDSGIEVQSLNGAPGVFTANWAQTKEGRDFTIAMERLWSAVQKTNYIEYVLIRISYVCFFVSVLPVPYRLYFSTFETK